MKILWGILFFALVSCGGPRRHVPASNKHSFEELQAKRDLYIELAKAHVDDYGWLDFDCDSLLHNALAAFSGFPVDPRLARDINGKWHRRPAQDCYPNGSRSSISKDMFNGLMLWAFHAGEKQTLDQIYDYGKANNWVMGEAIDDVTFWGRVVFPPTMIYRLSQMIKALTPSLTGIIIEDTDEGFVVLRRTFEANLHIITILQNYLVNGALNDTELLQLEQYAKMHPRNGMMQAMWHKFHDGDQSRAIDIGMDESIFPKDELPSTNQRCTDYLWSTEEQAPNHSNGFHWKPCPEFRQHFGTDLMFMVKIMELP